MSMDKLITIAVTVAIGINLFKAPVPFEATTIEERAEMAGMTVEDFVALMGCMGVKVLVR